MAKFRSRTKIFERTVSRVHKPFQLSHIYYRSAATALLRPGETELSSLWIQGTTERRQRTLVTRHM